MLEQICCTTLLCWYAQTYACNLLYRPRDRCTISDWNSWSSPYPFHIMVLPLSTQSQSNLNSFYIRTKHYEKNAWCHGYSFMCFENSYLRPMNQVSSWDAGLCLDHALGCSWLGIAGLNLQLQCFSYTLIRSIFMPLAGCETKFAQLICGIIAMILICLPLASCRMNIGSCSLTFQFCIFQFKSHSMQAYLSIAYGHSNLAPLTHSWGI